MAFDELYKKVIDSCRAFESRRVPISLDFKIEDLRDALVESNDTIEKIKADNKRLKRALWLARLQALRNFSVLAYFQMIRAKGKKSSMDFNEMAYRIDLARVKFRAKAEEYK